MTHAMSKTHKAVSSRMQKDKLAKVVMMPQRNRVDEWGKSREQNLSASMAPDLSTTARNVVRKTRRRQQLRLGSGVGDDQEDGELPNIVSAAKRLLASRSEWKEGDRPPPLYYFVEITAAVSTGGIGSVYRCIEEHLLRRGYWKKKKNPIFPFHFVIGEARGGGMPWQRLATAAQMSASVRPLCNFCPAPVRENLCSKAQLVHVSSLCVLLLSCNADLVVDVTGFESTPNYGQHFVKVITSNLPSATGATKLLPPRQNPRHVSNS